MTFSSPGNGLSRILDAKPYAPRHVLEAGGSSVACLLVGLQLLMRSIETVPPSWAQRKPPATKKPQEEQHNGEGRGCAHADHPSPAAFGLKLGPHGKPVLSTPPLLRPVGGQRWLMLEMFESDRFQFCISRPVLFGTCAVCTGGADMKLPEEACISASPVRMRRARNSAHVEDTGWL